MALKSMKETNNQSKYANFLCSFCVQLDFNMGIYLTNIDNLLFDIVVENTLVTNCILCSGQETLTTDQQYVLKYLHTDVPCRCYCNSNLQCVYKTHGLLYQKYIFCLPLPFVTMVQTNLMHSPFTPIHLEKVKTLFMF